MWGARTHAIWLGSSVFDGARVFEGVTPDLDLHCARVNASAKTMYLKPTMAADEIDRPDPRRHEEISQGRHALRAADVLGRAGGPLSMPPDPDSTRFALTLYDSPMRKPEGFSVTLSPFRRPTHETAPVDAKAGCLYPNNARALFEAQSRGFDNCLVCDVARQRRRARQFERVHGQGRRRVHADPQRHLPRRHHPPARDRAVARRRRDAWSRRVLRYADFENADEIFSTGNASKVMPVNRIGERSLQPGPLFRKARELYWDYAHS